MNIDETNQRDFTAAKDFPMKFDSSGNPDLGVHSASGDESPTVAGGLALTFGGFVLLIGLGTVMGQDPGEASFGGLALIALPLVAVFALGCVAFLGVSLATQNAEGPAPSIDELLGASNGMTLPSGSQGREQP